ncbi:MAG: hypothetical protein ACM3QZ_05265 [Solirubrobacterales bacterium]
MWLLMLFSILMISLLMLIPTIPVIVVFSVRKDIETKWLVLYTVVVYGWLFWTGTNKPPETKEMVYLLLLIPAIHGLLFGMAVRFLKANTSQVTRYSVTAIISAIVSTIIWMVFMFV